MAGMGKRMRPHTLTVPKPLVPIAGKPIVQRLVEDIAKVCGEAVEEVAFIIGRSFGPAVEAKLAHIAQSVGATCTITYQDEPLGTAHAILCAQESLSGKLVVAFADTLFRAEFSLAGMVENTIWVQKVEDPKPFGVVTLSHEGAITGFVEKPEQFVSDLAIIGIYYFTDGALLRAELQYLLDNDIKDKGEYQLTNALENMRAKGVTFRPGEVADWLDCGNKNSTVDTNTRYMAYLKGQNMVDPSAKIENSVIIQPCYIGPDAEIINSVVGPYASIGKGTRIRECVIRECIIQEQTIITNVSVRNSMIGSHVTLSASPQDLSVGDYNQIIL
jgi:glucose-1-phosphate thymidylyltransferase